MDLHTSTQPLKRRIHSSKSSANFGSLRTRDGGNVLQRRKGPGMRKSASMVQLQELPSFLADNEYLLDNHRPEMNSYWECIKSALQLHTETWNIWTHLVGCVGVVCLALYYLLFESENWHQCLSFAVFFGGAIICMGCSTVYHTIGCHSEPVYRFWAKMDYCGIVVLIVSSFAPWCHFGFYCRTLPKCLYIAAVFVLGILSMIVVAADRFKGGEYRALRAGVFIGLGLCGLAPGLHFMFINELMLNVYFWLIFMALLYITGGVIYALRIPERLFPGKFDIWCQSHQILHICVMGGVLACYQGASKLAHHKINFEPHCPSTLDIL